MASAGRGYSTCLAADNGCSQDEATDHGTRRARVQRGQQHTAFAKRNSVTGLSGPCNDLHSSVSQCPTLNTGLGLACDDWRIVAGKPPNSAAHLFLNRFPAVQFGLSKRMPQAFSVLLFVSRLTDCPDKVAIDIRPAYFVMVPTTLTALGDGCVPTGQSEPATEAVDTSDGGIPISLGT